VAAARAGAAVRFLGGFGDDVDGRELRRRLTAAGVDAGAAAAVEGVPTGSAYVLVTDDGENRIVVVPGANRSWRKPRSPGCSASDQGR
jgi:ribokinase